MNRTFRFVKRWLTRWTTGYSIAQAEEVRSALNHALNRVWEDAVLLTLTDKQLLINLGKLVSGGEAEGDAAAVAGSVAETRTSTRTGRSWFQRLFAEDSDGPEAESFDALPSDYEVLLMERSEDIAEQLCLVEKQVFEGVDWCDLLNLLLRPPPNTGSKAEQTTLQRAVYHFNGMCHWFVEQLTRPRQSSSTQTQKLKKLIKIGHKSLARANYATAMQAALALQNHCVQAMREAWWDRLPKQSREQYEQLVEMASPLKNFRTLRLAIEARLGAGRPCCPFLGLYISDLGALAEAPVDYAAPLVPWYKYRRAAELIAQARELQRLASTGYTGTRQPALYRFLSECEKHRKTTASVFT